MVRIESRIQHAGQQNKWPGKWSSEARHQGGFPEDGGYEIKEASASCPSNRKAWTAEEKYFTSAPFLSSRKRPAPCPEVYHTGIIDFIPPSVPLARPLDLVRLVDFLQILTTNWLSVFILSVQRSWFFRFRRKLRRIEQGILIDTIFNQEKPRDLFIIHLITHFYLVKMCHCFFFLEISHVLTIIFFFLFCTFLCPFQWIFKGLPDCNFPRVVIKGPRW